MLNSLFSEAMERSISLLKPFGRFLELGKRDFYGDTKIGLRPFRRNVSYFGIDADQLLNTLPELSTKLLGEIAIMFERGELSPLPYRAFHPDEIVGAFRLMQGSGHVGKIVVKGSRAGRRFGSRCTTRPIQGWMPKACISCSAVSAGSVSRRLAGWSSAAHARSRCARVAALPTRKRRSDQEMGGARCHHQRLCLRHHS